MVPTTATISSISPQKEKEKEGAAPSFHRHSYGASSHKESLSKFLFFSPPFSPSFERKKREGEREKKEKTNRDS